MDGAGKGAFLLEATAFLGEATQSLARRVILVPAIMLLLGVVATDSVALLYPPVPGTMSIIIWGLTVIIRVIILLVLSVAILRLATDSARHAWVPDSGAWLYLALLLLIGLLPTLLRMMLGEMHSLWTGVLVSVVNAFLLALFAPWLVAAASVLPLAWRPAEWLRRFGLWFPQRFLWALLLIMPVHVVQMQLPSPQIVREAWFWPVMIAYSLFGFLMLIIRLALDVAAYRRVAQDSTPRLSTDQQTI